MTGACFRDDPSTSREVLAVGLGEDLAVGLGEDPEEDPVDDPAADLAERAREPAEGLAG